MYNRVKFEEVQKEKGGRNPCSEGPVGLQVEERAPAMEV